MKVLELGVIKCVRVDRFLSTVYLKPFSILGASVGLVHGSLTPVGSRLWGKGERRRIAVLCLSAGSE